MTDTIRKCYTNQCRSHFKLTINNIVNRQEDRLSDNSRKYYN